MTKEMAKLRASASAPPEPKPMMMMKFAILEKEREELRATLKKSEDQLDSSRREIVALKLKSLHHGPEEVHVEV